MYFGIFPSRDYVVGAASGVLASTAAVLVMHPIESVKVRMQSAQAVPDGVSQWRRLAALIHRPYYGIGPHFIQYSVLNFIRFGSYAAAKGFFSRRSGQGNDGKPRQLLLPEVFACGAFSGVCIAAVLHPLFVVKTHQQINRLSPHEAVMKLWHGEGIRGLFRTYLAGFVRFPLALGVFFSAYEALKHPELWSGVGNDVTQKVSKSEPPSFQFSKVLGLVSSGAIAGVACWTSVYPLDVVQSRVIGEAHYGLGRKYDGALSCFRTLYREEGIRAFTRGYSAVLMRSGPVNAILLPVNDAITPFVERCLP